MAEALVRIAREPELRRRLSANALADADTKHSIRAAAEAYQALYDEAA
jgi:glycosyltransferase involved in cell wall biosynthesis